MGIFLITLLITIVFTFLLYVTRNHDNLFSEFICPLVSILGYIVLGLLIFMIVISYISIPANSIKLDEEYKSIKYQMENTTYENRLSKKLLVDQIKDWNSELKQNTYYHNNFWTNVFFPIDYSKYEYIELEEIQWME